MTAQLLDQNGNPITSGIEYVDWGMSSTNSIGTFINVNELNADFKPLNTGTGNIYVNIWYNGQNYIGSVPALVNNDSCNQPVGGNPNPDNIDHNSPGSAPQCTDQKPGSAPVITNAQVTGDGEVTIYWNKANDPITYYLISYGDAPGKEQFGVPNAGDKNTTQYTVKGLTNGVTYYFKVKAVNGCTPGEFSNELSAGSGNSIVTSGTGFSRDEIVDELPTREEETLPSTSPSATPEGEVLGADDFKPAVALSCQNPWWWWLVMLGSFVGLTSAAIIGAQDKENWRKIALPTSIIATVLIILFFCDKLLWIAILAGLGILSYVFKSILNQDK